MTSNDVVGLVNLMYRPNRRLPIVVVSDNDQGAAQLDTRKLAVRLSGAAHLIALDAGASWELTRLLGKRMSTFSGAVRIYMPGLVEDEEDAYQHPLWLAPNSGRNNRLIDILAERVFPLGFRDSDGESHFWHLAQLRQTASAAQARRQAGSDVDQLRLEVELLKERLEDVNETLETAEALEKIAADNEKAARYEVELLKNENNRLREKLYHLQYSDSESKCEIPKAVDRHLASYDDIEDWSNDLLGPNIFIHRKALKDCRQNGHPDMLERIENTLLVIRDYWIPYKIHGGIERRNDMITALGRLGVEDEACFARRERAKERDDYSVPDGNVTRILYDHFKYGNSRNNSEQFRIYYSWDEDGKRLIIGKMPSHLPNDMS
ncbi:MAG TPA: hypothetical protein DDW73_12175 [Rhizobium sp.]|nr:hypothetical protein [Rhizobium sp.]